MIRVKGYRLLVKPDIVDLTTPAGLVLAVDKKLEQASQVRGYVHSVGERCWEGHEPYAQVGDYIIFSRYAGKVVEDVDGEQFIILNDEDVLGTLDPKELEDETLEDVVKALDSRRERVSK